MLSVTGMPYDTIRSAIGIEGDYPGSLKDFSIKFEMTELNPDGTLDYDKIASDHAEKKPKMDFTYSVQEATVQDLRSHGEKIKSFVNSNQ